jgi:hypothetical protein
MTQMEPFSERHVVADLRMTGGVVRGGAEGLRLKAPFFHFGIRIGTFVMCHF